MKLLNKGCLNFRLHTKRFKDGDRSFQSNIRGKSNIVLTKWRGAVTLFSYYVNTWIHNDICT